MHCVTAKQIGKLNRPIQITIHHHEGDLYVTQIDAADMDTAILADKLGKPFVAKSLNEVRSTLQRASIDQAYLVMKTPYDEMIGNPNSGPVQLFNLNWH